VKVALTGGTGFVGSRVARALAARGDRVVVVTRAPERHAGGHAGGRAAESGIEYAGWDLSLDDCDAVVHLAGEPLIGKRWSPVQKGVIRASRIDSTRKLVAKLAECKACSVPRAFVCASAIGYYGDRGDELLPEDAAPGSGFVSEVCVAWEAEAARAAEHGARVVSLRFGVVLGRNGGALARMLLPFRLGLGGPIGNGRQYMSWVHVDDVAGLVLHALDHHGVRGALNATAPGVVQNAEFSRALGRALHRPAVLPAPAFGLRLLIGEAAEILTASQRCVPERTLASGFAFRYPELDGALAAILAR
jgi:uncharacterized protein (TIGR01777 family)